MRKIQASGRSFLQGANDSLLAGADEKPPMQSSFTYDYWLDTTLVTQKEYAAVTGVQPIPDTSRFGRGDAYPQYEVTWYDAILFCNKKSKLENLDTVYSYSGSPQMQSGNVIDLPQVIIHYDRDGYRLPTEAEWEFAAREGTSQIPFPHLADSTLATAYGWFSANAGGQTHPVAQLIPNAFGIYDLVGNVYEWTNDWKGTYAKSAITNSVGAPYPSVSNVKVIKGGAFDLPFLFLRPSRRGAVYETVLSTAAEYIGFRCARGVIPCPTAISTDTTGLVTNPIGVASQSILDFFGTTSARLVFVNVTDFIRTLCYVDFSSGNLHVQEFKDFSNVYVPSISPNGKNAAFCTRDDGSSGNANIYIRSLDSTAASVIKLGSDQAFEPRWWVDPVSSDTFLIYTNSAIDNSSAQWPQTKTLMQKMQGRAPVGAVQVLTTGGSFHDGRSKSGRFLVSGYRSLKMRDLTTDQDKVLFIPPQNGKDASGSSQACNVSMAPDASGRCLFLDFGYSGTSALTSGSYGIHQYIFVTDYTGTVQSWLHCPNGETSWNCSEWSNLPQFAVACGSNDADEPHAVYAINMNNSQYLRLATGTVLQQPVLWISPDTLANPSDLDLDSLGQYGSPSIDAVQGTFMPRIHGFWKNFLGMTLAFVGTSHTSYAIDRTCFPGESACNFGVGGGDYPMAHDLIKNYILPHCPGVKVVGMDLVMGYLFYGYYQFGVSSSGTASSKGYQYDAHHNFWASGLPSNFVNLITAPAYPVDPTMTDPVSELKSTCNGWGKPDPEFVGATTDFRISGSAHRDQMDSLVSLIRLLASRHIHLLLYNTPSSPYYHETQYYGRYGPWQTTADTVLGEIKALEDSFPYFHFYDAYNFGNHDYVDSEAHDHDHLCPAGARKFSRRLDSIIRDILAE